MASPLLRFSIAFLFISLTSISFSQKFGFSTLLERAPDDQTVFCVPNNAYGYGKIHAFDLLQEVSVVAQPIISWGGGTTLISSAGDSYQWHLDGEALIGETGQNHISAPPYGSYEVEVISAEGCTAFSDPLVTFAGINELAKHGIKVYPNPTESSINIESNDEIIDVNIVDLTGKSISLDNFKYNSIDLAPLTTGTYFLSIRTVKGTSTIKIVKI